MIQAVSIQQALLRESMANALTVQSLRPNAMAYPNLASREANSITPTIVVNAAISRSQYTRRLSPSCGSFP